MKAERQVRGESNIGIMLSVFSVQCLAPPKLPPDLVESDEEDDEMPDLVTTDTADIPWSHIKTG